jgi:hypothetical protein
LQVAATLPTFIAGVLADHLTVLHVMGLLGLYVLIVGVILASYKSNLTKNLD